MPTFTIHLNNLRFFGYHGLYEEERIAGNEFEVNLHLRLSYTPKENLTINDTVNYAEVHQLVKEVFSKREDLLETICVNIADAVGAKFKQVQKLSVQITKLQMPVTRFIGTAGVTFEKDFRPR